MPNDKKDQAENPVPEVIEQENDGTSEDTAVSEQPNEETKPEADGKAAEKAETATEEGQEAAPAAYTPNYKFKVLDKEQEIDEFLRGVIKDADTEKKVRELYEKAYGLDHVKTQRDTERQERAKFEQNFNQVVSEIQELAQLRETNLPLFLKRAGVSEQALVKLVYERAQAAAHLENLPEELRSFYNKNQELTDKVYELETQLKGINNGQVTETLQARKADLSSVLGADDIKSVVEQFDARVGKPGSFETMVMRHAAAEWDASQGKRDLTAKEAVEEVLKIIGHQAPQPKATGSSTPKAIQQKKPAVLPEVGAGTGSSTAVKRPTSTDELRQMYKQKLAAGG